MIELVSAGLAWLWALVIFLHCMLADVRWPAPRPLTSSTPRGLEWRAIRRVGPRVVAFRLQLVIA